MIRVAFIKKHGFHLGGTEILLQRYAAYLDKEKFSVDYYSEDPAIDAQKSFLEANGVRVHLGRYPVLDLDTDIVHSVAGDTMDYWTRRRVPLVESVTLICNEKIRVPDYSVHMSEWQRREWCWRGYGSWEKSCTIPSPIDQFPTGDNLRSSLGIEPEAVVTGLIQREDDNIYSAWPLKAWERCAEPNRYFLVMGGSKRYEKQSVGMENVFFMNGRNDLEICRFYNTLDFLTHGRKDGETYGTVIADALAHGLPILSHSGFSNGHQETIGKAGYFCRWFWSYQRKMNDLFESPGLRYNLSKIASKQAEQYSRRVCMEKLESLYADILLKRATLVYDFFRKSTL
jgi:glycosyltransferase involved in cell wall biosynthesis